MQKSTKILVGSIAIAIAFFLLNSSAFAAPITDENPTPECYSKAQFRNELTHFTGIGFDNGASTVCMDQPAQHQVLAALEFVRQLKFKEANRPSGDDLSKPLLPDDWSSYLKENIDTFEYEPSCPQGMVAFVQGVWPPPHTMHVCPYMGNAIKNSVSLGVMAVMHEAWHIHSPVDHVYCSAGSNANLGFKACDESPSTEGSYAITIEVLAKLAAKALNVNPVLQENARSSLLMYALNSFNQPPRIVRNLVPLLLTTDGFLKLDTPKNLRTLRKSALGNFSTMLEGDILFLPNDGKSDSVRMSATTAFDWTSSVPDLIEGGFQNLKNSERLNIRGLHYGYEISILLRSNVAEVYCNKDASPKQRIGGEVTRFRPQGSKFVSLVYPKGFSRTTSTVTIQNENGQWADVTCSNGDATISGWRVSDYSGTKKVMKINGTIYALTKEGGFFRREVRDGKGTFVSDTNKDTKVYDFHQRDWIQFLDGD